MAQFFMKATPQIEADKNLLRFNCYEEYLDSLGTKQDNCYLQSIETSRFIANLGLREILAIMSFELYAKATPQIEADRYLMQLGTYDNYLDSLRNQADICYFQSVSVTRFIASLGYRSSGETLSREQFERRLQAVKNYLFPPYKAYELSSENIVFSREDPFVQEIASRERANRIGILSTIIFLRTYTKGGIELSGYIDYTERLTKEDWKPIFRGKKILMPRRSDLGFYHWKSGDVVSNDSFNYKVLQHPYKGLLFQNRFDRKTINPDPDSEPGPNTSRKRIYTKYYELCIIFDHVVRQRI